MCPKAEQRGHAFFVAAVFFLFTTLVARSVSADPITLQWDANPASDNVIGYTVYIGTQSGVYTQTVDVGNATTYVYPNAVAGTRYYFAVSAYTTGPISGARSAEATGFSDAPPTLLNPGNQISTVGTAINPLQLQGSDSDGPVSYAATGLPPGLTLQGSTGLITSTATASGVFNVTATVSDTNVPPLTDSKSFTWTVNGPAPTVTLSPDPAAAGATLSAALTNGPGNPTDWVGLYAETAADSAFLNWCYLNGTRTAPASGSTGATVSCLTLPPTAGRYQARLFSNNGFTRLATSNTITATALSTLSIAGVTKAEGNSGTSNAVFTVTLSSASTQTVTVQYATSNGTATAGSDYTAASGTLTFAAGVTSRTISATRSFEPDETFTVTLSAPANATLAAAQANGTIANDDVAPGPTVVLTPDPAAVGTTLNATVTGGPANTTDWVALFAEGASDTSYVAWCYLNGTKTAPVSGVSGATVNCFTANVPGRYEVRFFSNNTFTKIATSNAITVPPPAGPSVSLTPNPATVGDVLSAAVSGDPGNATDWVGLYPEGAADKSFVAWCYLDGTKTARTTGRTSATVSCFTPLVPGRYQVRLFANSGYTKLATSNTITVPGTAMSLTPDPATVGATLTTSVWSGPANATDWIGLFVEGTPDTTFLDWCYLNGTRSAPATGMASATVSCFTAPASGRYQIRMFTNNTFTKAATSNTINVP